MKIKDTCLKPQCGDNSIIIIIADAWTQRIFHQCLNNSLLPEIKNELIDRGTFLTKVTTVFPSVSLSSHATLLTSVNQTIHGIAGHRWMERGTGETRNYIGLNIGMVNKDLSNNVHTIFEKYKNTNTFSINSVINRGAKRSIKFYTTNSKSVLEKSAGLICKFPSSLFVIWLPKGDAVSHIHGPNSKQLIDEMINTSKGIGLLTNKMKLAGLLDNARIIFTTDHGQKPVKQTSDLSLFFEKLGHSSKVNVRHAKDLDVAIFTSGDSSAYIYFNDKKFTKDFKYDILLKLRIFEGVGLIFYKYNSNKHYIFSKFGISEISIQDNNVINYKLLSGNDPLEILNSLKTVSFNINILDATMINKKYPDVIHQYLTSFVSGRSSDVLVTSDESYHFGKTPRIGWRFGYHMGSHGGPSYDEMVVSAIVTGNNNIANIPLRSKDLLNTVL